MIKIKLLEGGVMPVYKTKGAACADCYARVDVNIPFGKRALVPFTLTNSHETPQASAIFFLISSM